MLVLDGVLERVGEGTKDLRWGVTKYSIIQVGKKFVKSVCATETVGSFLDVGENMRIKIFRPIFGMKLILSYPLTGSRLFLENGYL